MQHTHEKTISIEWDKGLYTQEKVLLSKQMTLDVMADPSDTDYIKDWRNNSFLINDNLFLNRLRAENITLSEMNSIFSSDFQQTCTFSHPPEWVKNLMEGFKLMDEKEELQLTNKPTLTAAFYPFLALAKSRLENKLEKLKNLNQISYDKLIDSALHSLASQLTQIGARTLVLELNISRLREELEGETTEERFISFVHLKLMNNNQLINFYQEYITLARLLITRTMFFVEVVCESIDRFVKDIEDIAMNLNVKGKCLQKINIGLGDSHQRGRSVIEFEFDDETKILYKPKPLSIAFRFKQLTEWFNAKGFSKSFKSYTIIDKNTYSWEEKVYPSTCHSTQEIKNFYYRFGGILGVMYLIKGNDFHFENLIASGEYPMIIDFETLFQNHLDGVFEDSADVRAKFELSDSVLGTGLLPIFGFKSKEGIGIEMSGLGGKSQQLPFPVLHAEKENTDEMCFVKKPFWTQEKGNRPKLKGRDVDTSDYLEDILEGFKQIVTIAIENKKEFISENGPIVNFKDLTVRHIIRNTNYYANFLIETNHPDFMRNALDREKILDRMYFSNFPANIIAAEKEDLVDGDVPYFTTLTTSTDLFDSKGRRYTNVFAECGYEKVIKKIKNLTHKGIKKQMDWIRDSILSVQPKQESIKVAFNQKNEIQLGTKDQFLIAAINIADDLLEKAIWGPNLQEVTWTGVQMSYNGQHSVSVIENGLYDGVSGIALFLGYLGQITKKEKYIVAAKAAMNTATQKAHPYNAFLSAFYGPISLIHPLLQLDRMTGESKYDEIIYNLINYLKGKAHKDHNYDLIGGAAGIIQILLNYYEYNPNREILEIALEYGDHLCQQAIETENGVAWKTITLENQPLLGGLGHGTSGITWSLFRLSNFSQNQLYKTVAVKSLQYDKSLFDANEKNWLDKREPKRKKFGYYWCHGASGIGYSRIQMLPYYNKDELVGDIKIAIETILSKYQSTNHSLCHGDMGIADFLLTAGRKLENEKWTEMAYQYASKVMHAGKFGSGYRSGIVHGLETPSLFLGLSGIGLGFLRFAYPDRVPSILILEQK